MQNSTPTPTTFDLKSYMSQLNEQTQTGVINFPTIIKASEFKLNNEDLTTTLLKNAVQYINIFMSMYLGDGSQEEKDEAKNDFAFSPSLTNLQIDFGYDKVIKFSDLISLQEPDTYLPTVLEQLEIPTNSVVHCLATQLNINLNTLRVCDELRDQAIIGYSKDKGIEPPQAGVDKIREQSHDELMYKLLGITIQFAPMVILQWELMFKIIEQELELTNKPLQMLKDLIDESQE